MFETDIKVALDQIDRMKQTKAMDHLFEHSVRYSEGDAWYQTVDGKIKAVFGNESEEYYRWDKLKGQLRAFVRDGIRMGIRACGSQIP